MAGLQALLRALASSGEPPGELCRKLNRHLHQVTDASRFATLFYGEWHRGERRVVYANAGHNPPLLIRGDETAQLVPGGIPLGILPDAEYETGQAHLGDGDVLVLFSDGVTEARNGRRGGEEFGPNRLEAVARAHREQSPAEIESAVLAALRGWTSDESSDDVTLVIVKAGGPTERGAPIDRTGR